MATLTDILSRQYPGTIWSLRGDDYSTLTWFPENTVAKPDEATLRADSDAVDSLLAEEEKRAKQQDELGVGQAGKLMDLLETLIKGLYDVNQQIADLRAKLREESVDGKLIEADVAAVAAIDELKTKVDGIRTDKVVDINPVELPVEPAEFR